ncbi:MAG TPA: ABC transporter substrate-binding protein, partial [Candidatus Limnocylindrales bacterium]
MKLAKIGALAATAVLVIAGCSNTPAGSGGASGATGGKSIKIGTEFPMSGAETANGEPSANGVKLAIKQANAKSAVAGYTIDINLQDDAVNGVHNPQQGATNLHTLVADTAVVGVVGPFN